VLVVPAFPVRDDFALQKLANRVAIRFVVVSEEVSLHGIRLLVGPGAEHLPAR
jgi:hypothetical protein